jgi:hypothetical protein
MPIRTDGKLFDIGGRVVGQRHHRQLRVDRHGGGEDARVADVDVLDPVDPEALVDDSLRRIRADRVASLGVRGVQADVGLSTSGTSSVDMNPSSQYLPFAAITLATVDPGRGEA